MSPKRIFLSLLIIMIAINSIISQKDNIKKKRISSKSIFKCYYKRFKEIKTTFKNPSNSI